MCVCVNINLVKFQDEQVQLAWECSWVTGLRLEESGKASVRKCGADGDSVRRGVGTWIETLP